ncbi:MAG: hypothetical protein ABIH41_05915 [Nanoarchaeota archaeon]
MTHAFSVWRVNRVARLRGYIKALLETTDIQNKKDLEKIGILQGKMDGFITRLRFLIASRFVFYIIIYASIVLEVMDTVALPEEFKAPLVLVSRVFGVTLAIAAVLALTRAINLAWEDVRTLSTHIISIIVRHDTTKAEDFEKFIKGL